jgi:hypothetical protein
MMIVETRHCRCTDWLGCSHTHIQNEPRHSAADSERTEEMESISGETVALIMVGGLAMLAELYVHFLPSIIAYKQKQPSRTAILLLNVVFGWTLVGWVAALAWALVGYDAEQHRAPLVFKIPRQ